jgi:uncharacterized membrane protein
MDAKQGGTGDGANRPGENRSGWIGALAGFGLALSLILFGVLKTLFLLVLSAAGYYIGRRFFSNRKEIRDLLDRLLPPGRFR